MSDISDTRKRAELRGREAVPAVALLLLIAVGIALATERMKKGGQVAAVLLLCLFIAAKLAAWLLGGERWYAGAFWAVIIIAALVNGIWGTFALARIRREAELVPARTDPASSSTRD